MLIKASVYQVQMYRYKIVIFLYICESQNWPVGPGGEISLLGVAAPLSSRKTGYLLRVAHMIPIIFFRRNGSDGPPRDSTHWLCLPRFSVKRMGTIIFFVELKRVNNNKTNSNNIEDFKKIDISTIFYTYASPKIGR